MSHHSSIEWSGGPGGGLRSKCLRGNGVFPRELPRQIPLLWVFAKWGLAQCLKVACYTQRGLWIGGVLSTEGALDFLFSEKYFPKKYFNDARKTSTSR